MSNVESLYGGPSGAREPDAEAIEALEGLLEMAKSGELVGFACAVRHFDGAASWRFGGMIGGYGLIGSIETMKGALVQFQLED